MLFMCEVMGCSWTAAFFILITLAKLIPGQKVAVLGLDFGSQRSDWLSRTTQ